MVNGIELEENVLEELDFLKTLEVLLIGKRILLKKIVLMPQEQTPKSH